MYMPKSDKNSLGRKINVNDDEALLLLIIGIQAKYTVFWDYMKLITLVSTGTWTVLAGFRVIIISGNIQLCKWPRLHKIMKHTGHTWLKIN